MNNKIYIGKSLQINRRLNVYKNYKPNGKVKGYLKNTILKYGWDSFKVEILESFNIKNKEIDNIYLLNQESHYIKLFNSIDPDIGFNICKYSTDATGTTRSKEVVEKIRKRMIGNTINKGRKMSEETKEKIRQGNLGKEVSDETKEKQRLGRLGKVHTLESIEKMKIAKSLMSDETKEKMKAARQLQIKLKQNKIKS